MRKEEFAIIETITKKTATNAGKTEGGRRGKHLTKNGREKRT